MENCIHCHLPRAASQCEGCEEPVCKKCLMRFSDEEFQYATQEETKLGSTFCPTCYDQKVVPVIETYKELLERAKEVGIWPVKYQGHIPILSKSQKEISFENRKDRDDVLMQLGFRAAELGFNGLIKVNLVSKKVRNHGYQKMTWSGSGVPVKVDQEKLQRFIERDEKF